MNAFFSLVDVTLALRSNMGVFTKKIQEYVPLRNMQVSIAALQKFVKTYHGEEWCNDKIIWLNSKIKLNTYLALKNNILAVMT